MKRYFIFSALAIAGVALVCCNRSASEVTGTSAAGENAKYISIYAGIQSTRVSYPSDDASQFEDGDALTVYAWIGDNSEVLKEGNSMVVNGVNNVCHINPSNAAEISWVPEKQMLWEDMKTDHFFLGVYPARKGITNFKSDDYVMGDSTLVGYEQSDLLIAVNNVEGIKATTHGASGVPLNFKHALAKLQVNLSFRNEWDPDKFDDKVSELVDSVYVVAKKSGKVNYIAETITCSALQSDTVHIHMTRKPSADSAWTSLQIPDGANNATSKIVVWVKKDGESKPYTYIYKVNDVVTALPFTKGQRTMVNLNVGRDSIKLAPNTGIRITDWEAGSVIEGGEAQN